MGLKLGMALPRLGVTPFRVCMMSRMASMVPRIVGMTIAQPGARARYSWEARQRARQASERETTEEPETIGMFLVELAGRVLGCCIGALGGISSTNYIFDRKAARELVAKAKEQEVSQKILFENDTREQIGELQNEVRKINPDYRPGQEATRAQWRLQQEPRFASDAFNKSTPLDGIWGKPATRWRSLGVETDTTSKDSVEKLAAILKDPEQSEMLCEMLREMLLRGFGTHCPEVGNSLWSRYYDDDDDDD